MSETNESIKRRPFLGWRLIALTLLGAFALTIILRATVLEIYTIPSNSMEPTLETGEKILVNRVAYISESPERGDLIVFDGRGSFTAYEGNKNPLESFFEGVGQLIGFTPPEGVFVKRVIAVEDDQISCCADNGSLELNGSILVEDYLAPDIAASEQAFDVVLPPDRLWLMGDNRPESADSRSLLGAPGGGVVPVDRVIGKVIGDH